jgi:hypothetical protein
MSDASSPTDPQPTIERILRDLQRFGYSQTGVEALQQMDLQLQAELEELRQRAAILKTEVEAALVAGDAHVFDMLKDRITKLRGGIESRRTKRERIFNALQQEHLSAGMARLLGSRLRVALLEGFIFVLIVLVLGLLAYDFSTPVTWGQFSAREGQPYLVADPADQESAWALIQQQHPNLTAADVGPYELLEGRPQWLSPDGIFLIDAICCLIFLIEFFMRRSCADSKSWFWRKNWMDFFTSIPVPGEAQLARFGRVARVARFARILRFSRVLRAMRVVLLLWRGMDKLQDTMDVKLMKRSLKWGVAVMLIGGLLIYFIESRYASDGNDVRTLGGGLWWSFTTVVTGGFGDIHNPVSGLGRFLTIILVVTGMILVGVFTATLTSLYVGEESEEIQQHQDEMNERISRMEEAVREMSQKLGERE